MTHALIIDDNMSIVRAIIEKRLTSHGFGSLDQTSIEAQAIKAAGCHCPDLVVGHSIACGSPGDAAQHIAAQFGAPILRVTSGFCDVRRHLPEGAMVDGPFLLSDIGAAVALARRPPANAGSLSAAAPHRFRRKVPS